MERRLILAIAISMLIIVAFQHLAPKPPLPPVETKQAEPLPSQQAEQSIAAYDASTSQEEKEYQVENQRYLVTFSNIGGAIKKIYLKDATTGALNQRSHDLISLTDPAEYIYSLVGSVDGKDFAPALYECDVRGNEITCTSRISDIEIIKKYILHNSNYIIELQLSIKNISAAPKEFRYRIIGGSGLTETRPDDQRLIEVTSKINGKSIRFKRPRPKERITNIGQIDWTDLKSKYYSIILKPFVQTTGQFHENTGDKTFLTGVDVQGSSIPPGSAIEQRFMLYAGPSHADLLRGAGNGFEETLNYGFFGSISGLIISTLGLLYKISHNWGVAIILLSVLLNVVLFPLTLKSLTSMRKMQQLQPKIEKIKAQCKDNPQKLNKETMELYKKYKINPFSGCVPLLLQMPIFIALYQTLMKSLELRNARFLWIKDLSSPEAIKIPFSLPLIGDSINILPLVMVAAMVIQQKMSSKSMGSAATEEQKQQQKMMLVLMPVMFGFIFYNMPSGLVLYWVVNTVLTIVEQSLFMKNLHVTDPE